MEVGVSEWPSIAGQDVHVISSTPARQPVEVPAPQDRQMPIVSRRMTMRTCFTSRLNRPVVYSYIRYYIRRATCKPVTFPPLRLLMQQPSHTNPCGGTVTCSTRSATGYHEKIWYLCSIGLVLRKGVRGRWHFGDNVGRAGPGWRYSYSKNSIFAECQEHLDLSHMTRTPVQNADSMYLHRLTSKPKIYRLL